MLIYYFKMPIFAVCNAFGMMTQYLSDKLKRLQLCRRQVFELCTIMIDC
ncbi:hypothetical protein MPOCJGCO_1303 [Methylobacterium trifolii]|uniref:Uncharacterized protein n=1 Tax=Methylobacterium trifolii TaxID=1003092 RepID=A0ABQ4TVF1_9HYPH|nr:hypothetical protein MPOCJGCO_1303 [Methylobacterium trifolii]